MYMWSCWLTIRLSGWKTDRLPVQGLTKPCHLSMSKFSCAMGCRKEWLAIKERRSRHELSLIVFINGAFNILWPQQSTHKRMVWSNAPTKHVPRLWDLSWTWNTMTGTNIYHTPSSPLTQHANHRRNRARFNSCTLEKQYFLVKMHFLGKVTRGM